MTWRPADPLAGAAGAAGRLAGTGRVAAAVLLILDLPGPQGELRHALQQRLPDRGGVVKNNSTAGRVRPAPRAAVTPVVGLKDSFARAAGGVTSDPVLYAPRAFAAQGKISPIGM